MPEELRDPVTWERHIIEKHILSNLEEERLHKRGQLFFRLFFITCFFISLFTAFLIHHADSQATRTAHVGLVQVNGIIGATPLSSADNVIEGLKNAFQNKNTFAIILQINSPGGDPVQSDRIYEEIRYLRSQYPNKKIYTVCDEICCSGGYYIAAATDTIYADHNSIIGSIGVTTLPLSPVTFGFVKTLKKLGIERRLFTAGKNKDLLDPFSPLKPENTQHIKEILNAMHQNFIQSVKQGRGKRLSTDPKIFSGSFWLGEKAKALGLIDEIGSLESVSHSVIKNDNVVDYTLQFTWFEKIFQNLQL